MSRKQVADVEHLHKRLVHLERIKKIKDRKPGTSNTLDNAAPEVIEAMYVNPRKVAKKKEFNRTTGTHCHSPTTYLLTHLTTYSLTHSHRARE
jgi:hypothetical protein